MIVGQEGNIIASLAFNACEPLQISKREQPEKPRWGSCRYAFGML